MRFRAQKIALVSAVLILCMAVTVSCATQWQFFVWNGLSNDQLGVDDETPQGPNNFIVYTRGENELSDYQASVSITPDPTGDDDADCEVEIAMLKPDLKFRDESANFLEGYVVYVYQRGFYPANDNLGTGTPIQRWPDACVFH
ncbi:hypothetical protein Mapa_009027 [Marchantia paleacea]|nr:hypothetical protein Mapa_009027 [Marchantia paleacea]